MIKKDYRALLGFNEKWFSLGLLTEKDLDRCGSIYETGVDTSAEHYRYSAFRLYLQENRPLSEVIALALYELGVSDPDTGMGQAMMADIVDLPECPASVLVKASKSGITHLVRRTERRHLLSELKSCAITKEVFNHCLASGDGIVHRYLIENVNLSPEQMQVLADQGANKPIRNLASVKLRQHGKVA